MIWYAFNSRFCVMLGFRFFFMIASFSCRQDVEEDGHLLTPVGVEYAEEQRVHCHVEWQQGGCNVDQYQVHTEVLRPQHPCLPTLPQHTDGEPADNERCEDGAHDVHHAVVVLQSFLAQFLPTVRYVGLQST